MRLARIGRGICAAACGRLRPFARRAVLKQDSRRGAEIAEWKRILLCDLCCLCANVIECRIPTICGSLFHRHPGEGRDLTLSVCRTGEIPAFAGMTDKGRPGIHPKTAA